MVSKTTKLLRSIKTTAPKLTPIATDMIIPNLSGDHGAGRMRRTPENDLDIANKKYVDDNAGGAPGGDDTQVQFNDGGTTFGGDAGLTYNKTTDALAVLGSVVINGAPGGSAPLEIRADNLNSDKVIQFTERASGSEFISMHLTQNGDLDFKSDGGSLILRLDDANGRPEAEALVGPGDTNTLINFTGEDKITLEAGGIEFLKCLETTQDILIFNDAGVDVDFRVEGDNDPNAIFVEGSSDNVGIGTASPLGKLDIDQSVDDKAIPVLYLDQADVSEEFIRFDSAEGTGNTVEDVAAKSLTTTKFLKINVNGTDLYIAVGTIA